MVFKDNREFINALKGTGDVTVVKKEVDYTFSMVLKQKV